MKKLPGLQSHDLMLFIMKVSVIQFVIAAAVSTVAFCGITKGQGVLDKEVTIKIENIQLRMY
jgi:hypothetical protein